MSQQVEDIQRGLVLRGHDLGRTGAARDGIDGDLGALTLQALHDELGVPLAETAPIGFALSRRDEDRLTGVHSDLVRVVRRLTRDTPLPFAVIEGLRTLARQKQLVASGASRTMNSRHLTGHAVDLAPLGPDGKISWDWPLYHRLAPAMKAAAAKEGVAVEWGGDWRSFKDGPHWQLPWKDYPA